MRTGGGYIIFAGYQFMLGSVSTQRLSSDHVGGNTFVNALDFLAGCGTCWLHSISFWWLFGTHSWRYGLGYSRGLLGF